MDFGAIIKRAWQITKTHRTLWWLGLLVGIGSGGAQFWSSFNSPDTLKAVGSQQATQVYVWISNHLGLIITLGLILLILFVIIRLIGLCAQAGLILSIDKIQNNDNKTQRFGLSFSGGKPFAWRLFGLALLILIIRLAAILLAFALGAIFMILYQQTGGVLVLILGIIVIIILSIILVAFMFYLTILQQWAMLNLVLTNSKVRAAVRAGHQLLHAQPGKTILVFLIGWGLNFIYGFVTLLLLALPLITISGIVAMAYFIAGLAASIIIATILMVLLAAAALLLVGVYSTFIQSYWLLAYNAVSYINKQNQSKI